MKSDTVDSLLRDLEVRKETSEVSERGKTLREGDVGRVNCFRNNDNKRKVSDLGGPTTG